MEATKKVTGKSVKKWLGNNAIIVLMPVSYKHLDVYKRQELSWNRIKHPSEVVSVGDTIEVYVKDIDTENHKVSLGYKKAEDNPWEQLKNNYPIGSTFHAPVVSLTKFGAFVRILPGVDGLVHISEISNDRVEKVSDALKVGDMVDVKLLDVDFDKKRISLSLSLIHI